VRTLGDKHKTKAQNAGWTMDIALVTSAPHDIRWILTILFILWWLLLQQLHLICLNIWFVISANIFKNSGGRQFIL